MLVLLIVIETFEGNKLPTVEATKELLQKLFDGNDIPEDDIGTLKWILRHLIQTVVGSRWNYLVREQGDKKKSFTYNVSASDIGFVFYLLEFYSKSAILFKKQNEKEKKNRWSKETLNLSLDFYTDSSMQAREMYKDLSKESKQEIDDRVLDLLREDSSGDEEDGPRSDQNEEEKKEVYADCSFFDNDDDE